MDRSFLRHLARSPGSSRPTAAPRRAAAAFGLVVGLAGLGLAIAASPIALGHDANPRTTPSDLNATVSTTAGAAAAAAPARASEPAEDTVRRLASRDHVRYETRHWLVLSDADVAWTREQGGRLERTVAEYRRVMRRLGIEPGPIRHKLVCVLFDDRADYRRFARSADQVAAEWVAGYYSPAADRTVFYRADANPSVVAARARLAELEDDLAGIESRLLDARREGDLDRARRLETQRTAWRKHLGGESRRISAFTNEVGVATIIHEAAHQLLFHTGVQSGAVPPPIWISEGLATAFETDSPSGAFGPDFEYPARRDRFRELMATGAMLPLRDIVRWDEVPSSDSEVIDALYHQAYALTTWLFRARRGELRSFLIAIRDAPPRSDADRLAAFERAFGPVDRLEKQWLRAERSR